jgi:hypothetical protein
LRQFGAAADMSKVDINEAELLEQLSSIGQVGMGLPHRPRAKLFHFLIISMAHSKAIVIGIFEPQDDEDLNVSFKKRSSFHGVPNPLARIMAAPSRIEDSKVGQSSIGSFTIAIESGNHCIVYLFGF